MGATHLYAGIVNSQTIKTIGDATINSYAEAKAFWEANYGKRGHRFDFDPMPLSVANAVKLVRIKNQDDPESPAFAISYYGNQIVRYYACGLVSFCNCGFPTVMTCTRIRQFAPKWVTSVGHSNKCLWIGGATGIRENLNAPAEPGKASFRFDHNARFDEATGALMVFGA